MWQIPSYQDDTTEEMLTTSPIQFAFIASSPVMVMLGAGGGGVEESGDHVLRITTSEEISLSVQILPATQGSRTQVHR